MPLTPEQQARERIDALLVAAGWVIQNNAEFNRNAAEGAAVREFVLPHRPLRLPSASPLSSTGSPPRTRSSAIRDCLTAQS